LANRKSVVADFAQLTLAEAPKIDDNPVPIVFLIGLPGAGKTSLRARFAGYSIISRDDCLHQVTGERDYRKAWQMQEAQGLSTDIDALVNAQFQQALADNSPILMDMTNLSRQSRRYWLSQLPNHYSPGALLVLACDQTLAKRNQERLDKSLDPKVMHDMMLRFEHPLFDEFEQINYVVEGNVYGIKGSMLR
jgi:predicted kinase